MTKQEKKEMRRLARIAANGGTESAQNEHDEAQDEHNEQSAHEVSTVESSDAQVEHTEEHAELGASGTPHLSQGTSVIDPPTEILEPRPEIPNIEEGTAVLESQPDDLESNEVDPEPQPWTIEHGFENIEEESGTIGYDNSIDDSLNEERVSRLLDVIEAQLDHELSATTETPEEIKTDPETPFDGPDPEVLGAEAGHPEPEPANEANAKLMAAILEMQQELAKLKSSAAPRLARPIASGSKPRPNVTYTLLNTGVQWAGTPQVGQLITILNKCRTETGKTQLTEPELVDVVKSGHDAGLLRTKQEPWKILQYYRDTLVANQILTYR